MINYSAHYLFMKQLIVSFIILCLISSLLVTLTVTFVKKMSNPVLYNKLFS